jgi:cytoskeleton protein RodZ
VESFGARLKREREQRKISLDDISVSTKIGTRFLIAIEEEQFDQLPGGIFSKGFVRAYARYLGIDEAQAVADYVTASGASLPEATPEPLADLALPQVRESATKERAAGLPWEMLAIALLVVAFGFAIWGFLSREKSRGPAPVAPAPVPASSGEVKSSTATPANPAPAASPSPAPVVGNTASESRIPETQVPESSAAKVAAGSAPGSPLAAASAPNPGAFLVQITAHEDSWVAISADGKEIMQGTLSTSAEKSVGARNEIVIKTGNAGALDVSFNGKKLGLAGANKEVKTLRFDPNGLRQQVH